MNTCCAGRTLKTAVVAIGLAGIATFFAEPLSAQTRATCGPSPVGATCAGGGPASLGNTSGTDQGAGNPINIITGNKYQRETDMAPLPGELGLEVVRHYNSQDRSMGSMGVGWRLSYDTEIVTVPGAVQVLEADGSRIVFTRDPRHRSLCATDNPSNGVLRILQGRGGVAGFLWTWPNGRQLRFNAAGKLESVSDDHEGLLTLARDTHGEVISITDPLGRMLRIHYARVGDRGSGVIATIDSPIGRFTYSHVVERGRKDFGNLTGVTLSDGRTVRQYLYEPLHQGGNPHALTGIVVGFDGEAGSVQRLSTYAYQSNGRALWSMRGAGLETTAIAQGPQIGESGAAGATLINARGEKTRYTYAIIAGEQRLLSARGPGCAHCGEINVRHRYDRHGRLTSTERLAPNGTATGEKRVLWDDRGRIERIRMPSISASRFHDIDYLYDNASSRPDLPVAQIEQGYSPSGSIRRRIDFVYDKAGRLQVGGGVRYVYDRSGRVLEKRESAGRITRYQYDALSRAARIVQPGGNQIHYRYDSRGRISMISVNGRAEQYDYDPAERIARVVRPNGEVLNYAYDAADRVTAITDAFGRKISFDRDAEGLLIHRFLFDPAGTLAQRRDDSEEAAATATDRIALDPARRPVGFVDDRGVRNGYSYDDFGRLAQSYSADGGVTRFVYGADDRLMFKELPSGIRVSFRYDEAGRLIERSTPDGTTSIEYGRNLRPSKLTFRGGEERYAYDPQSRLIERISRIGDAEWAIRYRYDATGALMEKELPGGQTLKFNYRRPPSGNAGLLESISLIDRHGRSTLVSNLNDEREGTARRGFNLLGFARYDRELDVEGRITRVGAAGLWEQRFTHAVDTDRAIHSSIRSAGGIEFVEYAYDDLRRLIGVGSSGTAAQPLGFAFDAGNNLIGLAGKKAFGFTVQPGTNRPSGSYRFSADGSVVEDPGRRFIWDDDARLKSVIRDGRVIASYAYNASGQRIQKTTFDNGHAVSTGYIYEQDKLTAEVDERGQVTKQYVWLDDQPVAMLDGERVLGIVADQTYAPRAMVDRQHGLVSPGITNLRGSNQYFDAESGLLYNGRRYLDPETGRYISVDPMGLAGGSNPYAFAGNDRVANIDLTGLQALPALTQDQSVADWTLNEKLGFIFEGAASQIADRELAAALRDLVSPQALATTAIIFSTWAASQFTPYGWAGDIALTGIGALFLGKSIWDVIETTYHVAAGLAGAKCQSDLQDASSVLARGLSQAAAALTAASVTGAAAGSARIARLLRTIFFRDMSAVKRSSSRAAIDQSWFGIFNPSRGPYAGRIANREWRELQRANGRSDAHPPWDPRRPVVDTWLNPGDKIYVIQDRNAGPGGWATPKRYQSLEEARNELAVLQEFKRSGNDLVLQEYVVSTAIPVREGFAGPQVSGWPASESYVGGGQQLQFLVDLRGSSWETYLKPAATIEISK